jgi:hypothetical protein
MHTQTITREVQSAPATALQASRRMTAREMSQTIGGDWFTELVQVVGAAVSGYQLSTSVGWFCALVSCT